MGIWVGVVGSEWVSKAREEGAALRSLGVPRVALLEAGG